MPFFTCIVLSHNKPAHVADALASLSAQTFPDWEAIVFDSGVLTDRGFFNDLKICEDPRFRLIRSWETEELRRTKTIASWCFNECFRQGLVQGRYVTYLCDDDLLYPGALSAFYDHVQGHAATRAMYASIDMTVLTPDGRRLLLRESIANELKGKCCRGGRLDGEVDYLQLCHHIDVLKVFPGYEYWPEDRAVIRHADGVFLEQIGRHYPIVPVAAKVGENRKVPESLNDGGDRLEVLEQMCRRAERIRSIRKKLGVFDKILVRCGVAGLLRSVARRLPGMH